MQRKALTAYVRSLVELSHDRSNPQRRLDAIRALGALALLAADGR